ncbi:MAG: threonine/serine exporter family protein [Negativicutes bacterium]|jgi:uncharacterized membrane protein YjjP (DUF1212 family)
MYESDAEKIQVLSFLERLAEAMTKYGAPIYSIEDTVLKVAKKLAAEGEYLIIFGAFFSACGQYLYQKIALSRLPVAGFDVEKLNLTKAVADGVLDDKIDCVAAEQQLIVIAKQPSIYSDAVVVFSWWLASTSIAFLFGGIWSDALVAGVIGLIAAVISLAFNKHTALARLVEPLSAFMATFVAVAGMLVFKNYSMPIVLVCGLIILMPGFTFTRAMSELAMGHLISGTARLVSAMLTLMFLCAGAFVGFAIIKLFLPVSIQAFSITPPPPLALALICLPQAISLCLSFHVHRRYMLAVVIVDIIVVFIMIYGGHVMGSAVGCGAGAFVVCIMANAYARWKKCSSVVIKVPCIMVLVPGSVGFNAMVTILASKPAEGIEAATMMIITGLSIVVGSTMADGLFPSR